MNGRDLSTPLVVGLVLLSALVTGAVIVDGPLLGSTSPTPGDSNDSATTGDSAVGESTDDSGGSDGDGGATDESDAGDGDTTGGTDAGASGEAPATESESGPTTDGGDATTDAETGTPEPADFRFDVDRVEDCGTTCRDVTLSVRNRGGTDAENVEMAVRLLADGDEVWRGTQPFDRVEAGESRTVTRRVEIGYFDGARIQANDGYVTIETTITWDGGRQSFSERRKVA
ncbi:hypothetical protein ACFO0N_10775 [Halobium salinum]|uniref:Uncharacterized protein n=1 Tax=Halobium salinum TaxID=1364940 RepID=A0ABD5PCI0_9EURY|nr:hypothetical protein [Halobium salinum]